MCLFCSKQKGLKDRTAVSPRVQSSPALPQVTTLAARRYVHREARLTPLNAATKLKPLKSKRHRREEEESADERRRHRRSVSPIFPGRMNPGNNGGPSRCGECGESGCPGCACMCMESTAWIQHEGGHFFPTCTKCGGDDCPGCACTCPSGTELIEHGGHLSIFATQ